MTTLPIGRIRIPRKPDDMRVPDFMLQCVGFVAEYTAGDALSDSYDPEATGFFVNVPVPNTGRYYIVFVTARHVAIGMQEREGVLLVQKRGGGISVLTDSGNSWFMHPDNSVDVAVLPVNVNIKEHDIRSIPIDMFMDAELFKENDIGIGDEVFFPGLFAPIEQGSRFSPILRHGNIAMLSSEPIQVDEGFAEVHLIESRSIRGLSGSPVFVRGTVSLLNKRGESMHGLSGKNYLLGLIHGHWDIKPTVPASAIRETVNMGISVVVPAEKILETLGHPDLLKIWADREAQIRKAAAPTPD